MPTTYRDAPEVADIALDLIAEHHRHLDGAPIRYIFRDPPATSGGKEIWGKARKVSGLTAWLASDHDWETSFLVIEIAEEIWKAMDDTQRRALVDHELCHCQWDGEQLSIRGHDVEEFAAVIRRHGLWRPETEQLYKAAQLAFGFDPAEEDRP